MIVIYGLHVPLWLYRGQEVDRTTRQSVSSLVEMWRDVHQSVYRYYNNTDRVKTTSTSV